MKAALPALPALLIVLSLAACRGDEPDEAPPVGQALAVAAVAAGPVVDALRPMTAPDPFADAESAARAALDAAWAACGDGRDPDATRCRDDAFVAYDAAMSAMPTAHADARADADTDTDADGAPAARADLAAAVRFGTRG